MTVGPVTLPASVGELSTVISGFCAKRVAAICGAAGSGAAGASSHIAASATNERPFTGRLLRDGEAVEHPRAAGGDEVRLAAAAARVRGIPRTVAAALLVRMAKLRGPAAVGAA